MSLNISMNNSNILIPYRTQVEKSNSTAKKGWRSLDLTQSPCIQPNGGLTRPLYRTQRSRSVPVQQNPPPNVTNSAENQSPAKVRTSTTPYMLN